MSCRIVAPGANLVQPFLNGKTHRPAVNGSAVAAAMTPADRPAIDVTQYQARIAELERALQRDTQQAREAGMREGEQVATERAAAEMQQAMDRISHSIADLAGLRAKMRREAETDLVKLAFAIARRILRRELAMDPEAIQGLIKAALDKVQSRDITRVRLHPDFQGHVRRYLEKSGVGGIELVADPTLRPGDVLVDTKQGELDASIDTQLAEIERGFADRLGR